MLIPPYQLRDQFGVAPHGVLHVGAHEAEEGAMYQALGWGPVTWVEMLPDKAEELRRRFAGDPANTVIEAAAWGETGIERDVYEASNKQSSSLFRPQTHLTAHPEITFEQGRRIRTQRLDEVLDPALRPEFLNLDVQGAEVEVMKGLGERLLQIKWCYLEINRDPLYAGIPLRDEVESFLQARGFTRIVESIHEHLGWGDALYANGRLLPPQDLFRWKLRGAQREAARQPGVLELEGDDLIDALNFATPPAAPTK